MTHTSGQNPTGPAVPSIPAKAILSARRPGGWFASEYTMNLYRGCCHGCIYCDSRSECYAVEDFDTVRVKQNALALLQRDLAAKRHKGVVITGSMSDSYNPFEQRLGVTRGALGLLLKYGFGAAVDTKSCLVTRDADILKAIAKNAPATVNFTITALDDALSRKVEPHAPPTSRRLGAMAELSAGGIVTGTLLMPVLPFIEDNEENILGIVRATSEHGGRYVFAGHAFGVTLRQNQRFYFYDRLNELYPAMRARYEASYGYSYECASPRNAPLWAAFERACAAHGLLWRMEDINAMLQKPYTRQQTTLF